MVRTPDAVLVFDFWKDPFMQGPIPNVMAEVPADMPIYVFVSHFHKDHYNPAIFGWSERFSDLRFIVSRDVWKRMRHIVSPTSVYQGPKVDPERVTVMTDRDSYEDGIIKVRSFPSTDTGNSYAVETAGHRFFHAGDLNAWIWKDESTEEEVREALKSYTDILDMIAESYDGFDQCFFPVDSRIGTDYFTGARLFLERFKVGTFFPMHYELADGQRELAQRHRDAAAFDRYATPNCSRYILSAPYSIYCFNPRSSEE